MIDITLNGQPHQVSENTSVSDLLVSLNLQDKRVAVEVNRELVSRSEHAKHSLKVKDKVEIVHAIGGG